MQKSKKGLEKELKKTTKKTTKQKELSNSTKKKVTKQSKPKVKEKNNKRAAKIVVAFLVLLLMLVIYVISINQPPTNEVKYDATETSEPVAEEIKKEEIDITISPDVDLNVERNKYNNQNIVARLEVPGLINILIVRGADNSYYLNHSIKNKKDNKGTEFMDYRVNTDSKQINIYGHNSRTYDIPFRKLEKFLEKDYFEENKYVVLQTDSGRRIYEIFSLKEYASDYEYMKVNLTGKEYLDHLNKMNEGSLYSREVEYDENSNLLVLQTCSYGKNNTYYIISAIEVEE